MRILIIALLLAFPAQALAAATGFIAADYTGYSHGLTVLKLSGRLTLTDKSYAAHVTFHTAGLVGMLVHTDNDSTATGTISGDTVHPEHFESTGHLHGVARTTLIDYVDGDPVIRLVSPPVEQERTVVDVQDRRRTIDTLSALALLIYQAGKTGKCQGEVRTFDGRRLADQTVSTSGEEDLVKTDRSIFFGKALRCDFEGRQLAGFIRNEDEHMLSKMRHGTAWLANIIPNAPPVPVKVIFENRILGHVTLFLTGLHGAPQLKTKP